MEKSINLPTAKQQSSILLDCIEKQLKKAKITLQDLDCIAVCVGPGSFTGIRVAISTAKGLAVGLGCKVITYDSFSQVEANIEDKNFGILLDGFGDNYYYYFKKFGREFKGCATLDKIAPLATNTNVYCPCKNVLKEGQFREDITLFKVKQVIENPASVVAKKYAGDEFVNTNQIAPQYLRASQAEIEREKKLK